MEQGLESIRMLADAMSYLDRAYCHEAILDWVRTSPEGAAYSIVRRLFIEMVEESGSTTNLLRAA
jgi:hypothetical protein